MPTRRSPTSRSTCTATTATRDYSHDVDEDERGIAWVAGRGGIRGYATKGRHRDPYQNRVREATPFDPILVAGGGLEWDEPPDNVNNAADPNDGVSQATDFMHNSGRPTDGSVRAAGVKKGNVLIGTEEDFTTPCRESGRIVAVDLTDSLGGEPAQNSTRTKPVSDERAGQLPSVPRHAGDDRSRERVLGALLRDPPVDAGGRVVHPGSATRRRQQRPRHAPGRLLPRDAARATDNPSSNSWDVAWYDDERAEGLELAQGQEARAQVHAPRGDYVYLMDMSRGIEVIRLKARRDGVGPHEVGHRAQRAQGATRGRRSPSRGRASRDGGYVCPLFTRDAERSAGRRA